MATFDMNIDGDDPELSSGMEALRQRFASRGMAAKPGGKLRKTASTVAIANSFALEKTAIESVHGGLVVSLDADCRAYRAAITELTNRCVQLEEQAKPASELHKQVQSLSDELRLIRSQVSDANRMRETLQATVADLRQQLTAQHQLTAQQQQQLLQQQQQQQQKLAAPPEPELGGQICAERDALARRVAELTQRLDAETIATRAAAEGLAAAEQTHAEVASRLEARCAEGEAKRALLAEMVAGLRAELEGVRAELESMCEGAAKREGEAGGLRALLLRAQEEAAEARGESGALSRKLSGAQEKEKKEMAALKAEVARQAELVKALRTKLEAHAADADAHEARARELESLKTASKRHERRAQQLEEGSAELQSEVLRWRAAAEEARAEAEAAKARAEHLARSERPAAPLGPIEDARGSAFVKHMKTVQAQQAEIAQLREQVEHLSFLLSSCRCPRSVHSAATSPLKPPRALAPPPPSVAPKRGSLMGLLDSHSAPVMAPAAAAPS
jgi:hypothetical protein